MKTCSRTSWKQSQVRCSVFFITGKQEVGASLFSLINAPFDVSLTVAANHISARGFLFSCLKGRCSLFSDIAQSPSYFCFFPFPFAFAKAMLLSLKNGPPFSEAYKYVPGATPNSLLSIMDNKIIPLPRISLLFSLTLIYYL